MNTMLVLNLFVWPIIVPFLGTVVTFFISMIPPPPEITDQPSGLTTTSFRNPFLAELSVALFSHALWGVSAIAARLDPSRTPDEKDQLMIFLIIYIVFLIWALAIVAHSKVTRWFFSIYRRHFLGAAGIFLITRFVMYFVAKA